MAVPSLQSRNQTGCLVPVIAVPAGIGFQTGCLILVSALAAVIGFQTCYFSLLGTVVC